MVFTPAEGPASSPSLLKKETWEQRTLQLGLTEDFNIILPPPLFFLFIRRKSILF